ncbi:MAG: DNA/RNA non-specific endonuclease [Erysipelotrichaceae bacterium]|nr:DNA/RNA non-specific endonuclease [Erysipelotrichaceae bacterium]
MRKRRRKKKSFWKRFIMTMLSLAIIVFGGYVVNENVDIDITFGNETVIDLDSIPDYDEDPYIEINDNIPYFTDDEITTDVFEEYTELDSLGRCGVAYANICQELMPTEKRQSIGMIKPTGWQIAKYDFVDGQYLYNRCHLIGFQLAGENANEKNLITGTRYMNVDGMLPFENMVADYVKETDNHVLYRVTPLFDGNNLVASGVEMEAYSVEDDGEGICFNVYVYNVQPGIIIDYATGDNELEQ